MCMCVNVCVCVCVWHVLARVLRPTYYCVCFECACVVVFVFVSM